MASRVPLYEILRKVEVHTFYCKKFSITELICLLLFLNWRWCITFFVGTEQFIEISKSRSKIVIKRSVVFIVEGCSTVERNPVEVTAEVITAVFNVGVVRAKYDPDVTKAEWVEEHQSKASCKPKTEGHLFCAKPRNVGGFLFCVKPNVEGLWGKAEIVYVQSEQVEVFQDNGRVEGSETQNRGLDRMRLGCGKCKRRNVFVVDLVNQRIQSLDV